MNRLAVLIVTGLLIIGGASAAGLYLVNRSLNGRNNTTASQTTAAFSTNEPLQTQQRITQQNCLADTCLRVPNLSYPVATLTTSGQAALTKALDNEYKLQSYYQAVINQFGNQRPFAMIVGAEAQHIAVINALYEKYGLPLEANQWTNKTYSLTTFASSCHTAASYEQETVSLYNTLLPQVASYPDITQVFSNIKDAAQDSHLPAFTRCAQS